MSRVYDLVEWWSERAVRGWRKDLWDRIKGGRVLEVGAGTGKNLPYYPTGSESVGVDLSWGMLSRALWRKERIDSDVELALMDSQTLGFKDDSFDWVIGKLVLCSVPHPVSGLKEVSCVCKDDGRILLLENVRSDTPGWAARLTCAR